MRILILGGSGMLGHRLWMDLSVHHETWITVRSSAKIIPDLPNTQRGRIREGVDATNLDLVVRALASIQPDVVINCIGLVKQLSLSKDPLTSLEINASLPHRISLISRAARTRMIHFSTDCVFSGKKQGVYCENDQSDAEDLYGRTKFLGEVVYKPHTLTLRTSIIGRELRAKHGLVEWFISQRNKTVPGFQKAVFSGLTTGAIAKILLDVVLPNSNLTGLYHVSSEPISKFDLLHLINRIYSLGVEIKLDTSVDCNRILDSSRFRAETGFAAPTWQEMIEKMSADPLPYDAWKE